MNKDDRRKALDELVKISQELGLYDDKHKGSMEELGFRKRLKPKDKEDGTASV